MIVDLAVGVKSRLQDEVRMAADKADFDYRWQPNYLVVSHNRIIIDAEILRDIVEKEDPEMDDIFAIYEHAGRILGCQVFHVGRLSYLANDYFLACFATKEEMLLFKLTHLIDV